MYAKFSAAHYLQAEKYIYFKKKWMQWLAKDY
jgi:hypothetical protein